MASEVQQACSVNCGARCPLRFHVEDGRIRWVESDTAPEAPGNPQIRACLRGRAMRYWLDSPDRLDFPLRRTGARGSGEFERISWDEALDAVAQAIARTVERYGNQAVLIPYGTGLHASDRGPFARLMNCYGGHLGVYGDYSCAQLQAGMEATYGSDGYAIGSTLSETANADVVVMFGSTPLETRMSGGGCGYEFLQARERGDFRLYAIDPRQPNGLTGPDDRWIPLRPGTDAALAAAVAYVLIQEGMVDQEFLDRYCIGYDAHTLPPDAPANASYKDYILGTGPDATAKDPSWAAAITGVPPTAIIALARDIGTAERAFIAQGWGPQRSQHGETTSRAIAMLAILTGNVGLPGTNPGGREPFLPYVVPELPVGHNAVKARIPAFMWLEAVKRGHELTRVNGGVRGAEQLDADVKLIINHGGNCLTNQHGDINQVHEALSDEGACEFIVGIDVMMTDSMRYCDIVLPDLARAEQDNLLSSGNADMHRALIRGAGWEHPIAERRSAWSMAADLAERLGVGPAFAGSLGSQEGADRERLRLAREAEAVAREGDAVPFQEDAAEGSPIPSPMAQDPLPSWDELESQGLWRSPFSGPTVGLEDFRRDPQAHPLHTPSGKIEVYSARTQRLSDELFDTCGQRIPAIPAYVPPSDELDEGLKERFPLQLIGYHGRQSTHSSFANVDELKVLAPRSLQMNPIDAKALGLRSGMLAVAFNQRGALVTRVQVTPRIMPGVAALPQGAWHSADMQGDRLDWGGCLNTLTSAEPTLWAHGNPHNTCRAAVRPLTEAELEAMPRG